MLQTDVFTEKPSAGVTMLLQTVFVLCIYLLGLAAEMRPVAQIYFCAGGVGTCIDFDGKKFLRGQALAKQAVLFEEL